MTDIQILKTNVKVVVKAEPLKDEAVALTLLNRAYGQISEYKKAIGEFEALRRRSIKAYWEAGKSLAEAFEVCPHGSWQALLKRAGIALTSEYKWRQLYASIPETDIDRMVEEGVTITQIERAYRIGQKGTAKEIGVEPTEPIKDQVQETIKPKPEPSKEQKALKAQFAQEAEERSRGIYRLFTDPNPDRKTKRRPTHVQIEDALACDGQDGVEETDLFRGTEDQITCDACLAIARRQQLEAARLEREKNPTGSPDNAYVWELLIGDDPTDVKAKWTPVLKRTEDGKIETPDKTIDPAEEPVFLDRKEAIRAAWRKDHDKLGKDKLEVSRLKDEIKAIELRMDKLTALGKEV